MQQNELMDLVSKAAVLMEQFDRRCMQIDQRQQVLTSNLQQLAQQVPLAIRQSADGALKALRTELFDQVRDGLEQPVGNYEQRLRDSGRLLQEGAMALADEMQRSRLLHKSLLWKISGVVIGSLFLLLIGGGWLSIYYYQTIRDDQVTADLLKAYNAADVTLCDGRLCANVDLKGKHYGEAGQYLPTRAR